MKCLVCMRDTENPKFCDECDFVLDYVWSRAMIHPNYLQIRDATDFIMNAVYEETGEYVSRRTAVVVWGLFTFNANR